MSLSEKDPRSPGKKSPRPRGTPLPRLAAAVRVVSPRPSGRRKTEAPGGRPASPGRSTFPGVRRDSPRPPGKRKTEAPGGRSGALGRSAGPVQCHAVRMASRELPWRRSFLRGRDVECGMRMEGEAPGLPRKAWGPCGSRASRGRRRPPTPPPRSRRASPRSSGCASLRRRG